MKEPLITDAEIRHSNVLTNARFEYSELQLDLFFFILSRLKRDQKSLVYELDIKELSFMTGKKYDFQYLWEATDEMMSKVFWIKTAKDPEQLVMFQRIKFLTGTGIIEFKLTEDILSHLFDLKNNFTSYAISAALRLKSKYAKRLYPLCSQWKNLGQTKKCSIQDFKDIMGVPTGKLEAFKDFRVNVLEVARKQINETTELHIEFELEKRGKNYKNIIVKITPQASAALPPIDLDNHTPTILGIPPQQYENCVIALEDFRIKGKFRQAILASADHIRYTNRFKNDLKTGKIKATKNPGGLLLVLLELVKAKPQPA